MTHKADPGKKNKPPVPKEQKHREPDDYTDIEMSVNDRSDPSPDEDRVSESRQVITNKDEQQITNTDNDAISEKEKEGI